MSVMVLIEKEPDASDRMVESISTSLGSAAPRAPAVGLAACDRMSIDRELCIAVSGLARASDVGERARAPKSPATRCCSSPARGAPPLKIYPVARAGAFEAECPALNIRARGGADATEGRLERGARKGEKDNEDTIGLAQSIPTREDIRKRAEKITEKSKGRWGSKATRDGIAVKGEGEGDDDGGDGGDLLLGHLAIEDGRVDDAISGRSAATGSGGLDPMGSGVKMPIGAVGFGSMDQAPHKRSPACRVREMPLELAFDVEKFGTSEASAKISKNMGVVLFEARLAVIIIRGLLAKIVADGTGLGVFHDCEELEKQSLRATGPWLPVHVLGHGMFSQHGQRWMGQCNRVRDIAQSMVDHGGAVQKALVKILNIRTAQGLPSDSCIGELASIAEQIPYWESVVNATAFEFLMGGESAPGVAISLQDALDSADSEVDPLAAQIQESSKGLMDKIAKEIMIDGEFGQSSTSTHYKVTQAPQRAQQTTVNAGVIDAFGEGLSARASEITGKAQGVAEKLDSAVGTHFIAELTTATAALGAELETDEWAKAWLDEESSADSIAELVEIASLLCAASPAPSWPPKRDRLRESLACPTQRVAEFSLAMGDGAQAAVKPLVDKARPSSISHEILGHCSGPPLSRDRVLFRNKMQAIQSKLTDWSVRPEDARRALVQRYRAGLMMQRATGHSTPLTPATMNSHHAREVDRFVPLMMIRTVKVDVALLFCLESQLEAFDRAVLAHSLAVASAGLKDFEGRESRVARISSIDASRCKPGQIEVIQEQLWQLTLRGGVELEERLAASRRLELNASAGSASGAPPRLRRPASAPAHRAAPEQADGLRAASGSRRGKAFTLLAGLGHGYLGVDFAGRAPGRVTVRSLDTSGVAWWAQEHGLEIGDEVLAVNGRRVADIKAQEFDTILRRIRPLRMRFFRPGADGSTPELLRRPARAPEAAGVDAESWQRWRRKPSWRPSGAAAAHSKDARSAAAPVRPLASAQAEL
ncbi:unnamed protein product [Prorocentrum cordatum]|uniref:PDZ domain-containing protein n=1 Tax=Prorocentrum cordatum TaxID=2364126 RepID=A0ABN9T3T5_9DINO|nr:unnamed protein product [Polarella glacialis]